MPRGLIPLKMNYHQLEPSLKIIRVLQADAKSSAALPSECKLDPRRVQGGSTFALACFSPPSERMQALFERSAHDAASAATTGVLDWTDREHYPRVDRQDVRRGRW